MKVQRLFALESCLLFVSLLFLPQLLGGPVWKCPGQEEEEKKAKKYSVEHKAGSRLLREEVVVELLAPMCYLELYHQFPSILCQTLSLPDRLIEQIAESCLHRRGR